TAGRTSRHTLSLRSLWIEDVSDSITQQVEPEDGSGYRHAWEQRHPRRLTEHRARGVEDVAQTWYWRWCANAKETQACFAQYRITIDVSGLDDEWSHDIRKHVESK